MKIKLMLKKIIRAKYINSLLVILYAIMGILIPLLFPMKVQYYSAAALANLPLIIAWMGVIWISKKDKVKYGEVKKNNKEKKSIVIQKNICNIIIILYSIIGILLSIILPNYIEYYTSALIATDPFIIAWMGAIWGNNNMILKQNSKYNKGDLPL